MRIFQDCANAVPRPMWAKYYRLKIEDCNSSRKRWNVLSLCSLLCVLAISALGDQGKLNNAGGSALATNDVVISSFTTSPAVGNLNLTCLATSSGTCAGGNFTYASNDGTTFINATFSDGSFAENCTGGGRGGPVTCAYTFNGYFNGSLTVAGQTQAIIGMTSQSFAPGGSATGISAYVSAHTPFYYADGQSVYRADDLTGTNQVSFGTQGSGVGQFYGASATALDASGRIYVADAFNCRIVRIDDMIGTNWVSYGTSCGSGDGQFYDPAGIAVDSAGKIYVMDTGNSRVVRIDDMNGTNFVAYGTPGTGVGQFSAYVSSLAVDALGRIYVPDATNKRVARMDDMNGTNWTVLTQSPAQNNVVSALEAPAAVAFDQAGRIYIADNETYQPAVVRVDDMNGTNWTAVYTGPGQLNSISLDSSDTVFLGGGGAKLLVSMTWVLPSSGTVGPYGINTVVGVTAIPMSWARPAALAFTPASLAFTDQIVGTTSPPQAITIKNIGGKALALSSIVTTGSFTSTNGCPTSLGAGSSCTVNVIFSPVVVGPANGALTLSDDSSNLGAVQTIALAGTGIPAPAVPIALVTPQILNFAAQAVGTISAPQSVLLKNGGTASLPISGSTVSGPFHSVSACGSTLAPSASCTIAVAFAPVISGPAQGLLTITDAAGTQTVTLSGSADSPSTTGGLTISPSFVRFQVQAVGSSTLRAVHIMNRNRSAVGIGGMTLEGSADFNYINNCGPVIAPGAGCTVELTFRPNTPGRANSVFTISDDSGRHHRVRLAGKGRDTTSP